MEIAKDLKTKTFPSVVKFLIRCTLIASIMRNLRVIEPGASVTGTKKEKNLLNSS